MTKVFFDIDGVVCNLPSKLAELVSFHFGVVFTVNDMNNADWLASFPGDVEKAWDVYHDFVINGGLLKIEPFPDAIYIFDKLRQQQILDKLHIEFVTRRTTDHRSSLSMQQKFIARLMTAQWLRDNNFPFQAVKFKSDKDVYARDNNCLIFVEDTPENAEAIGQQIQYSFLLDRSWNQYHSCVSCMRTDWSGIYDAIIEETK